MKINFFNEIKKILLSINIITLAWAHALYGVSDSGIQGLKALYEQFLFAIIQGWAFFCYFFENTV